MSGCRSSSFFYSIRRVCIGLISNKTNEDDEAKKNTFLFYRNLSYPSLLHNISKHFQIIRSGSWTVFFSLFSFSFTYVRLGCLLFHVILYVFETISISMILFLRSLSATDVLIHVFCFFLGLTAVCSLRFE